MSRHAGKVAWLRPRRPTPPMRPGDSVAPGGVSRRSAFALFGVAVFAVALLSGVGLNTVYQAAQDAQRDATGSRTFTQDELAQITEYMDARRQARDAEQAARDAVLCTVLATLAREGAGSRETLTDAARDLDCPDLPKPRPATTSSSTSASGDDAGGDRSSSSPSTAPAPQPAPEPSTPAPRIPAEPQTPPPAAPEPLQPVTDGLCNLVGLCL